MVKIVNKATGFIITLGSTDYILKVEPFGKKIKRESMEEIELYQLTVGLLDPFKNKCFIMKDESEEKLWRLSEVISDLAMLDEAYRIELGSDSTNMVASISIIDPIPV